MKFEIKAWLDAKVLFTAELAARYEGEHVSVQLGAAVKAAYKEGAYLTGAYLQGADLKGADLKGADLTGAYLQGAYLQGADLTGADLQGAYLTGADLTAAYLTGAYLTGAYLTGAYLTGAYLTGADLTGAYLQGAYLTGADLKGAYLQGADLKGAYLQGADLTAAYLTGAYLTGAYLTGAYLTGADLTGADLTGAYLTGADGREESIGEPLKHATPEESIANLDKVREIVLDSERRLDMGHWHNGTEWIERTCAEEALCGTSHCLAGWLQVCATDKTIREMGDTHSAGIVQAPVAAKMFFRENTETLAWLKDRKYADEAADYA